MAFLRMLLNCLDRARLSKGGVVNQGPPQERVANEGDLTHESSIHTIPRPACKKALGFLGSNCPPCINMFLKFLNHVGLSAGVSKSEGPETKKQGCVANQGGPIHEPHRFSFSFSSKGCARVLFSVALCRRLPVYDSSRPFLLLILLVMSLIICFLLCVFFISSSFL